jgi:pimeloyl-ACP methyl ester carboxylesterase
MRGEEDPVSPREWCRTVTGLFADAEFAEVPGHGHETLISDARPAAERILSWLADR